MGGLYEFYKKKTWFFLKKVKKIEKNWKKLKKNASKVSCWVPLWPKYKKLWKKNKIQTPPCSDLFTSISFIIFHILATEAPSNSLLMHFFQLFSIFFNFFYFFQEKSLFFYVKFISPPHVQTFLYQFHKWFFIFWR